MSGRTVATATGMADQPQSQEHLVRTLRKIHRHREDKIALTRMPARAVAQAVARSRLALSLRR